MTIDVRTLFTSETATRLLAIGLELAASLGLNTTSWVVDSPERVLLKFVAKVVAERDSAAAEFIQAGFSFERYGLVENARRARSVRRDARGGDVRYADRDTLQREGGDVLARHWRGDR